MKNAAPNVCQDERDGFGEYHNEFKNLRSVMFGSQKDVVQYEDLRVYVAGVNDKKLFSSLNKNTLIKNYASANKEEILNRDNKIDLNKGITYRK